MATDYDYLDKAFDEAAKVYGVDANILRGIGYAESRFNPGAVGPTTKSGERAVGMMQIMPGTAKSLGINPTDPVDSIFGAAATLRSNLDKFGGDYSKAVAGYNWGPNRDAYNQPDWHKALPNETFTYVNRVLDYATGRPDYLKDSVIKPRGQVAPAAVEEPKPAAKQPPKAETPPAEEPSLLQRAGKLAMNALNMGPTGVMLRGLKEAAPSVLQIGPEAVKGAAQIGRLVTGDKFETPKAVEESMTRGQKAIQEVLGSEKYNAKQKQFAEVMQNPEKGVGDMFGYLIDNPDLLVDKSIVTIGSMFLPAGAARLAGVGTKALGATAPTISKAVTATTIGTTMAQNAANTYSELGDLPEADRYKGASISAAATLLMGVATKGGAEAAIARKLAEDLTAGKASLETAKSFLNKVYTTGLKEGVQETGEEAGGIAGVAAARKKLPEPTQAAKQLGLSATLGTLVGGVTGGATYSPGEVAPSKATTAADTTADTTTESKAAPKPQRLFDAQMFELDEQGRRIVEQPPEEVGEPTKRATEAAVTIEPTEEEKAPEATPEVKVTAEPIATEEPAPAAPAVTPTLGSFTTSKGSTYALTEDGQTIRTKRSEGKGQGETYAPHTAFYVKPGDHTEILSDLQGGMGGNSVRLGYIADGNFKPVTNVKDVPEGAKTVVGVFDKKTNNPVGLYRAQTAPALGLHPVEKLYTPEGESSTHIGNRIVSLQTASAEPTTAEKPEPTTTTVTEPTLRAKKEAPEIATEDLDRTKPASETTLTMPDIRRLAQQNGYGAGVTSGPTGKWWETNVAGKTLAEVQELVAANPKLLEGRGSRAELLRQMTVPEPPAAEPIKPVTAEGAPSAEPAEVQVPDIAEAPEVRVEQQGDGVRAEGTVLPQTGVAATEEAEPSTSGGVGSVGEPAAGLDVGEEAKPTPVSVTEAKAEPAAEPETDAELVRLRPILPEAALDTDLRDARENWQELTNKKSQAGDIDNRKVSKKSLVSWDSLPDEFKARWVQTTIDRYNQGQSDVAYERSYQQLSSEVTKLKEETTDEKVEVTRAPATRESQLIYPTLEAAQKALIDVDTQIDKVKQQREKLVKRNEKGEVIPPKEGTPEDKKWLKLTEDIGKLEDRRAFVERDIDIRRVQVIQSGKKPLFSETGRGAALPQESLDAIEAGSVSTALDVIGRNGTNEVVRETAAKIAPLLANTKTEVVDDLRTSEGRAAAGSAARDGSLVQLDRGRGMDEETLVHEGVHAASERVLSSPDSELTEPQKTGKRELNAVWRAVRTDESVPLTDAAREDVSEFSAEALSRKDVQDAMRSKTAPESKANLWQQFKRAVMKMVGMHQPKNMRDAVVDAMDKVFTAVPEPSGKTEYANVSGRTDAAEAFEPKLIEDLRKPEYKSREKLIQMPIDDFLALAEPGDTEFKAENVGALRKAGTKFNSLPFLTAYGARDGELRVEGHEGRHRARALKAAGYETMPVILRTDIRWSEQNDPNKFDYIESWPTRIVAEKGGVSLPMPVSREQAMDPYGRGTYDPNNPDIRYALSPGFERTIDNLPKNKQRPTAQFVKAASDSFSDNSLGEWLGGWIDRNIRTNLTDRVATAEMRIARIEGYAVRNAQNEINPLLQLRQAYDTDKLVYDFFLSGGIEFDPNTRQVKITDAATAPDNILTAIEAWAKDNDMSFDRAYNEVLPKIYEAVRLHNIKEQADAKGVKSRVIPHLPASFIADAVKEYNADPALQEITRLMDEPRLRLLDFGVETGRWTQKDADELKSVVGYVPFDRIMEVEGAGPAQKRIKGGVTSFSDIPTLIGTTEHEVRNVFDNYFNTISFLMSEAVRSGAATSTLRYMEGLGLAKDLGINPNAIKQPARTVSSFVDGVRHFYELPSRQDALAFKYDTAPIGNVLKVLSKVSKVFRGAITMYPTFSGKQLTEDLQRAALTTGVKNVAAVTTKAVSAYASLVQSSVTGERNPLLAEFGKKGLTAEIDWERKDPATSYLKDRGFRQRGLGDPFTRALAEMAHRLDGIAHASDLAVRSAVYSQIKEETGDEARAIAAARELINFRRQGAMESLTYIIPTMPFFNAKLQGLDIEYRAITGRGAASGMTRADAVKSFATRAAIAMAASSLYAMLKAGDDDYENVDRSKRDRMWMLPNGYGIPVPAEYGVIFKMIPEYALEYYRRKGTAEEQAASEAFLTWFSEAFKTYIGQSAPIPQQVKPLLENFVNFSFFTNRPLVGKYLEGVDASEQTVTTTSEGAKYVAKWVKEYVPGSPEVSPIKIDNFVQGYFGSMGAAFSMVLDSFINPDKIDRPLHRVIGLGPFTYEQGSAARKKDEFYDLREDADRAYKTLALLGTQGDPEKYNRYYEKMYPLLHAYDMTTATLDNLSDIRKRVNMLSSSKASIDAYIEEAKARGEKDPRQAAKDARYKDIKDLREFERNEARWVREMRTIIDKEKARLKTQGINLNAKP